MERSELRDRARLRGAATFADLDPYGYTGDIAEEKVSYNRTHEHSIEQSLTIIDAGIEFKKDQLDRTTAQKEYELEIDRQIFDDKIGTLRAKLALKIAAENYALAAREYDASVKKVIMETRIYAQQLEREYTLPYEAARADVAEQKQESRLVQLEAEILTEGVNRAQVGADIARMQVDVAKAQVRVLQAQYEAARAELDVINAQTQLAMSEAEKATLKADVAMTFAEIVMKQLSTIKLDLETEEIAHAFKYVDTRLAALLAREDIKILEEKEKTAGEADQLAALNDLIAATKAQDQFKIDKVLNELAAIDYEIARTLGWGTYYGTRGTTWADSTRTLTETKYNTWRMKLLEDTKAKQTVDDAETIAAKHTRITESNGIVTYKYIKGDK